MLYKQLTIYIIGFIFFVACEKADNKFAFPANKQIAHRGYWTKGAAENSLHAVVHIKSTQLGKTQTVTQMPDLFDFFFGDGMGRQQQIRTQPRVGFGSGVIISKDGYIVTNNHVIDGATRIEVTLNNNQKYQAVLVGTDPATDIALQVGMPEARLPLADAVILVIRRENAAVPPRPWQNISKKCRVLCSTELIFR